MRVLSPMDVSVSGPSSITSSGTYTWEAMPSGGDGTYTYQWFRRFDGSSSVDTLGTAKTQSLSVGCGLGDFYLWVDVWSAGIRERGGMNVYDNCGGETPQ